MILSALPNRNQPERKCCGAPGGTSGSLSSPRPPSFRTCSNFKISGTALHQLGRCSCLLWLGSRAARAGLPLPAASSLLRSPCQQPSQSQWRLRLQLHCPVPGGQQTSRWLASLHGAPGSLKKGEFSDRFTLERRTSYPHLKTEQLGALNSPQSSGNASEALHGGAYLYSVDRKLGIYRLNPRYFDPASPSSNLICTFRKACI